MPTLESLSAYASETDRARYNARSAPLSDELLDVATSIYQAIYDQRPAITENEADFLRNMVRRLMIDVQDARTAGGAL